MYRRGLCGAVGFMQQHSVVLATDMPIWNAPTGADAAFAKVSIARALQAGLTLEPSKTPSAIPSPGI